MYEVMIVDNDSTSLAIGKAILESEYKILLMKSGIQALGYLKSFPKPDIILLDMMMPGTSGIDTLKALRQDPNLCDIPVLFMTNMEDFNNEVEAFSLGAVDLLQKPLNPELIRAKMKRLCSMLTLQKENAFLRERLESIKKQIHILHELSDSSIDSEILSRLVND